MSMSRRTRLRASLAVALSFAVSAAVMVASEPGSARPVTGLWSKTPAPDCGPRIMKNFLRPWKCTFADDFNGTTLDTSKWIAQQTSVSNFTTGKECFLDSPNNVSVADGELRVIVRKEPAPFVCKRVGRPNFTTDVSAGSVSTYERFSQTYGRFEIRAAFPDVKVPGAQSALWMYPVTPKEVWPASGEIDIAEYYSRFPDRAIPFLHYGPTRYDPNQTNNWCMLADPSEYHTYLLEWTSKSLTISFDGRVCLKNTYWTPYNNKMPYPFNQPFMLALTQALGSAGNDYVEGETPLPAVLKVDYVRVWS